SLIVIRMRHVPFAKEILPDEQVTLG
ncbi:hypothetical protein LCGC14_2937200, partial [marine sediment metagenome]